VIKIKHFLVDVEGTVVKDKSFVPISGAREWLRKSRLGGRSLKLVSNNTTHTPGELYSLLREKGFEIRPDELVTCLLAAKERLRRSKLKRCFVIGSAAMKSYLRREGFEVSSNGEFEAVLVGLDERLTLQKLKTATAAILQGGAKLIAMHKGRLYVDRGGAISFSSGPIVSALEFACGVKATVVGKPSRSFYRDCIEDWRIDPGEVMMISDDPLSDLVGAKKMGMETAFVLSGAYPRKEVLTRVDRMLRPDRVVEKISELPI
jgi:4-nitrophenyl phosphatase